VLGTGLLVLIEGFESLPVTPLRMVIIVFNGLCWCWHALSQIRRVNPLLILLACRSFFSSTFKHRAMSPDPPPPQQTVLHMYISPEQHDATMDCSVPRRGMNAMLKSHQCP
jgi:hypothetical protein